MSGTKEGAELTVEKILARDPDFYKKIGRKGGLSKKTHCIHGLKFTKANSYYYSNRRACRKCMKVNWHTWYVKKKAKQVSS